MRPLNGGDGASAPLPATQLWCALLRRDLPRRGRRVDEIGGELRVARFGVLHRLLLHRAVAADAVGQRQDLDRGIDA